MGKMFDKGDNACCLNSKIIFVFIVLLCIMLNCDDMNLICLTCMLLL